MRRNLWLGLAVVLCGVSLWAGVRGRDRGTDASAVAAAAPAAAVHLKVLNGTDVPGLARDLGRDLGAAGLVIESVGNASPAPANSLLVNRRLDEDRAAALSRRLGGVSVVREWDARCSEDAVLVLGADWRRVADALGARP